VALQPVKRGLDAIARDLFAPFLDGSFGAPEWRLVGWDAEQGLCLTLESDGGRVLIELEERNERLDCYARTAVFNVCARRQPPDAEMTAADRDLVERVLAVVRRREAGLRFPARAAAERKTVVREVLVERLLMREGGDQYYVNAYVGCMIGCPFCYVIDRADFSRRLEGLPHVPWGDYLDVKVNAAEVLRREVVGAGRGIVRMSPILTDPYQPVERKYRITRQCLEVLLDTDLAPVVLTRAPRILDDLELLRRFRRRLIGFSVPTDQDRYRQIFEPGADPIDERLEALRRLHAAGIPTFAVIQPVLPMNAERMIECVAPFVRAVRLDRLYVGERVRHLYDRNGLSEFATDEYAAATIARLTEGFRARGVQVDSFDDLSPLVDP